MKRFFGYRPKIIHFLTADKLNKLAILLKDKGALAEAEAFFRRVLPIFEEAHGPDNQSSLSVVSNLALVLEHKRDLDQAALMYTRLLESKKNIHTKLFLSGKSSTAFPWLSRS